jgi:benzoyl-CoA reductase/2-hydroxyglutaryl-CoA dehydratase subunit BcrC/BadD/HgdB
MSALQALRARYEDPGPAIREWREAGGLVVGCIGRDVPRELVAAAGLLPVRLRGDGPPSALAEAVLGPGVDEPARRILAALLERVPDVDFILLCHDSDASVRLFTSLRALAPDRELPEAWFFDLLHLPTETTAAYNLDRAHELVAVLERWAGRPLTDTALREAISAGNETRRLLARVSALRQSTPPRLCGTAAFAAIGAAGVLPAAACNRLLAALLDEAGEPPADAGRRLYLTGSEPVSDALHSALEADGSVVVGEDASTWDGPIAETGDPLAAVVAAYTSVRDVARDARDASAELVVSWIRSGDDSRAWKLPELRDALGAVEIPLAVFEHRSLEAPEQAELAALR